MKKYFMYIVFVFNILKKISETPIDMQELQYPSDFSTPSNSSVLDDSENLQKEISTLESLYEGPLNTQELEYSESEM